MRNTAASALDTAKRMRINGASQENTHLEELLSGRKLFVILLTASNDIKLL